MVKEVSTDLLNSAGELDCVTTRCVQCGDILDPVILRNRFIRQEQMGIKRATPSLPSTPTMQLR